MAKFALALAVLAVLALPRSASASHLLGTEPPASLLVSRGGLEWVYAAPCAPVEPSCGVVVLDHGFFIPTEGDWNASFSGLADLIAAFGIPTANGFTGAPCAAPYFSTLHHHCDGGDVHSGFVWGAPFGSGGSASNNSFDETFLARRVAQAAEPTSILLVGVGLAAVGRRLRKGRHALKG